MTNIIAFGIWTFEFVGEENAYTYGSGMKKKTMKMG